MNRRAFLTALAAVTGAAAFPWLPEHEQPTVIGSIDYGSIDRTVFTWWRNHELIGFNEIEPNESAMRQAFEACMREPNLPDTVVIEENTHRWLKSQGYIA